MRVLLRVGLTRAAAGRVGFRTVSNQPSTACGLLPTPAHKGVFGRPEMLSTVRFEMLPTGAERTTRGTSEHLVRGELG